jgi:hypothetical protein
MTAFEQIYSFISAPIPSGGEQMGLNSLTISYAAFTGRRSPSVHRRSNPRSRGQYSVDEHKRLGHAYDNTSGEQ